jgi:hypothetical protein
MRTMNRQIGVALFTLCTCAVGWAQPLATRTRPDAWSTLNFDTGWILIGVVDVQDRTWATVIKHEFTKPQRPNQSVPDLGDIIRITMDQDVVIVGFKSSGEEKRLVSPAGIAESTDATGTVIRAGDDVVVRAVERDDPFARLQTIWARVEPIAP